MAKNISVTIKFWKQNGPKEKGHFDTHELKNIPDDTSFLEALDIMNEELINAGKEPFVFDHDCREGICGMCSLYINGTPHGKTERASYTGARSRMVRPSPSSHGVPQVSLSSRIAW